MNIREWLKWDRIALYRVYDDGRTKKLGERVLENSDYLGRIVKSILEDSNTPNIGSFLLLNGAYIEFFENGMNMDNNLLTDKDGKPPEIWYGPFIRRLAMIYDAFDDLSIFRYSFEETGIEGIWEIIDDEFFVREKEVEP